MATVGQQLLKLQERMKTGKYRLFIQRQKVTSAVLGGSRLPYHVTQITGGGHLNPADSVYTQTRARAHKHVSCVHTGITLLPN